jgi:flavodoxin
MSERTGEGVMPARKQILVVYYSLTGNTARVAIDLAARLDADLECIEDKRHRAGFPGYVRAAYDAFRKAPAPIGRVKHNPAEYALTVIGTPVWVGQMTPAVRAFLQQMSGKLPAVAFFITSGDTEIEKVSPSLQLAANCKPSASVGLNARELKQAGVYEQKLSAFVQSINFTLARGSTGPLPDAAEPAQQTNPIGPVGLGTSGSPQCS